MFGRFSHRWSCLDCRLEKRDDGEAGTYDGGLIVTKLA
jgi:hypothetical protein